MKEKVIVGMSGGVDSAVSAYLLLQRGYQVEGLFMKNWDKDDYSENCTAKQDYQDAIATCLKLGIKLHYVNFSEHYWHKVFIPFLESNKAGKTPNPDVWCNRFIKFDVFLRKASSLGARYIATGHYARQVPNYSGILRMSVDKNKDQTYFLCSINRLVLSRVIFPLGDYTKEQVRLLAGKLDLPVVNKKDSTGICFIGERPMRDFLSRYIDCKEGDIVDEFGKVIGRHKGAALYTIGQRSGLGVGGVSNKEGAWFVAKKDMQKNLITLVQDNKHPLLMSSALLGGNYNFLVDDDTLRSFDCKNLLVRLRHRGDLVSCSLEFVDKMARVCFAKLQRAVVPGQMAVLYGGDVCLGGIEVECTENNGN